MGNELCKRDPSHGEAKGQGLCGACYAKWTRGHPQLVKEFGPFKKVRPPRGRKEKPEIGSAGVGHLVPVVPNKVPAGGLGWEAKLEIAAGYDMTVIDFLKLTR